jgi:hypothetical protein
MKKMKKYATLRRRAARLLEKQGWIKGVYLDAGKLCLVGALCKASHCSFGSETYNAEIQGALFAMGFRDGEDQAIDWNDATRRRKHEVLARLRKGL